MNVSIKKNQEIYHYDLLFPRTESIHFNIVVDQVSNRPTGHRPCDDDYCVSQQLQK